MKEKIKKIEKEKVLKDGKKFYSEFKQFIARGNVMDLAVGVVIGAAFGKIVTSLVDDILMPVIGALIGGINFTGLSVKIGEATIMYGNFLQNIIDFLIVAACIFVMVKIIERFNKKEEEIVEEKQDEQIVLLKEIRDLLKNNNK